MTVPQWTDPSNLETEYLIEQQTMQEIETNVTEEANQIDQQQEQEKTEEDRKVENAQEITQNTSQRRIRNKDSKV